MKTVKKDISIEVADISTMEDLDADQYQNYLIGHLFYTDTHGIVRSSQGDYPIACNKMQLNILIKHLEDQLIDME